MMRRPVVWNLIEKRGRRPSHTFLDYALTYMVGAMFLAFTLGQVSAPASCASQNMHLPASGKVLMCHDWCWVMHVPQPLDATSASLACAASACWGGLLSTRRTKTYNAAGTPP